MSAERERVKPFGKLDGCRGIVADIIGRRHSATGNLAELLREVGRPVADDAPETTTPSPVAVG